MSAAPAFGRSDHLTVADLMSRPVLTVEVGETLWDAWQLLFVSGLRHLVVIDSDGASLGVLSDRNVLAEVPATSEHLSSRRVGEVLAMVPLISATPEQDPSIVARLMASNQVEAVPVLDDRGRLVGIMTESDIVRWAGSLAS
jgi:CBS domain-containing protein